MGYLREHKPGVWHIYISAGFINGKRKRICVTFHGNKTAAKRELARLETEIAAGRYQLPTATTFRALFADYQADSKARRDPKSLQEDSKKAASHILPYIGSVPVAKLTRQHLTELYAELIERGRVDRTGGLHPRTVSHVHSIIRKVLQFGVRAEILQRNVAQLVSPPPVPESDPDAYSLADVMALLDAASDTLMYLPVVLAMTTGLRRGEILGLTWSAIDLDRCILTVQQSVSRAYGAYYLKAPKTRSSRRAMELAPELCEDLNAHREWQKRQKRLHGKSYNDSDFVCTWPDGSPLLPDWISQTWPTVVAAAGVRYLPFKDLRHSFASLLDAGAMDSQTIARAMGHTSDTTTKRFYIKASAARTSSVARMISALLGGKLAEIRADEKAG